MASNILTDRFIRNAPVGRHADGDGLYLRVRDTGSSAWVLRVQYQGNRKDYGLGSLSKLSLADARAKAAIWRRIAAQGKDPKQYLRDQEEVKPPTFEVAAIERHEQIKGTFKNPKHAAQWLSSLKAYAFPYIGDMLVSDIIIDDIQKLLSPIWFEKPETANRVKQRIGDIMDMAHLKGQRTSDLPVKKIGKLLGSQSIARREKYGHHPSLAYEDMPELISRITSADISMGRLALIFQILTATRTSEVRFARWSEIESDVWTIPADRMKMNNEHIVPMSEQAINIINQVRSMGFVSRDDYIFIGNNGGAISNGTMSKVLKGHSEGLKVIDGDNPTVHGNRASFKTWSQEKMPTTPEPAVEASLAHKQPDKIIQAYGRSKFLNYRRDLLNSWSNYVYGNADNIVRLAG